MIQFVCDGCKAIIELKNEDISNVNVAMGPRAVTSKGKYGDSFNVTLCPECTQKIKYWLGGNSPYKWMKKEPYTQYEPK
jgi:uncharacterized protein with PIN domain